MQKRKSETTMVIIEDIEPTTIRCSRICTERIPQFVGRIPDKSLIKKEKLKRI